MKFNLVCASLLCSIALAFVGCSSSTDSTNTNDSTVKPNVGSTYTYDYYKTDSNNTKLGSTQVLTDSVVTTTLAYNGKTNVIKTVSANDSTFYAFESNGDVDFFFNGVPLPIDSTRLYFSTWWQLPFGTHKTNVPLNAFDTTITLTAVVFGQPTSVPTQVTVRDSASYLGDSTITVGSESLTAHKVEVWVDVVANAAGGVVKVTAHSTIDAWYVPKIGYFAKRTIFTHATTTSQSLVPVTSSGSFETLTSYHLK